jgi:hypothetical protein
MEAGEQKSATAELEANRAVANTTYMRFVKIARVAFQTGCGHCHPTGPGRRSQAQPGRLAGPGQPVLHQCPGQPRRDGGPGQLWHHHDKAPGWPRRGQRAVEASNLTQEKEKGEAQAATQTRDQALDALQEWLSDYLAIAKVALEDNPQLLEALGVLQRA